MAWKYVFLGTGLSVAMIAYWLYSPLPDGYSFSSAGQIQMMLASTKVVDLVARVGSYLGFDSHVNLTRQMINSLVSRMIVPDPEVQERDLIFDGVPVRLYEPVHHSDDLSAVVYYHGGGWVFGNLGTASQQLCTD